MTYRWLESGIVLQEFQNVGYDGEADLDLNLVPYLSIGEHHLTLEVSDGQYTSSTK